MNKKLLFGICMISLVLIISMPSAEAGWFEDTWNWLMNLLGIGEEEAKVLTREVLSSNVVYENLSNGNIRLTIIENTEYVFEDNMWKHKTEARSLKGKGFNCEVKKYNNDTKTWRYDDDGTHKIECDDFNWTSVTLYASYDEKNLQEYDKEVLDKVMTTKFSIIENEFDEKLTEKTEQEVELEEGKKTKINYEGKFIGKTFRLGEASTDLSITANNSNEFKDAQLRGGASAKINYGGKSTLIVRESTDTRSIAYNDVSHFLPVNSILLNVTYQMYVDGGQESNNFGIYKINSTSNWIEGTGDDSVVANCSHDFPNDASVNWSGANNSISALLGVNSIAQSNGAYNGIDLDITEVQGWIDDNSTNNGMVILYVEGVVMNLNWHSSEGVNPPKWVFEFEAPVAPDNPSPLVNSTTIEQTNLTNETLACNFLCDDDNEDDDLFYDMYWYKDGILNLSGYSPWADGVFDSNALEFDGVDDGIEIDDDNSLNQSMEITFGLWIKRSGLGGFQELLNKYDLGTERSWWIEFNDAGNIKFNVANESNVTDVDLIVSITAINDDDWHYIVGSYSVGNKQRIYIDGVLNVEEDTVYNISFRTSSSKIRIGSRGDGNYFNGSIDEVRIWNRTLQLSEILDLNNSNTVNRTDLVGEWNLNESSGRIAYDTSGNGNNGTLNSFLPSCDNPSYNSLTLASGNTSRNEKWACSVNVTDNASKSSGIIFSNNVTIINYAPYDISIVAPSLANNTETPNNTNPFNCSAEDLDNDTLHYEIYLDANNPPTTIQSNQTTSATNTSVDGDYWWRCRAVDEYSGASPYSNIRFLTIDNSTIKNYTANFSATTTEGSLERFEFNISYNPIQLYYVNAKLVYQNVNYDLTQENLTDALTRFYLDLTIPSVSSDPTTTQFYFNITDGYINGSIGYENSINYTQTVNKVDIFSCDGVTNSTQALAYNFTFWDETNNSKINDVENVTGAIFEANFLIWKDDKSINDTLLFDVDNKTEINICISPVDEIYNADAVIEYNLEDYDKRFYYLSSAILNNATQNISLYLLLTSRANDIILNVQDAGGSPQVGALIYAQRYYTGLDAYTAVAMGRTNDDGQDTIPLRKTDTIYRFIIKQSGITTFTSYPAKIIENELTFTVDPETLYDIINEFEDVDYSLIWSNDSRNVILTYSTDSGLSRNFCLRVTKLTTSGDSIKYDNCLSSASGTITAKINETGQYNALFYGKGDIQHAISKLDIVIGVIGRFVDEVGLSGIFYLILINGVLVGMGIAMGNAIFALLAPLIGTIFLTIFGIVNISWAMIVGLAFVIIIAITLLKEK